MSDLRDEIARLKKQRAQLRAALRSMLHDQPDDPDFAEPEEWERWHRAEERAEKALRDTHP
jgi:hypothetical protein